MAAQEFRELNPIGVVGVTPLGSYTLTANVRTQVDLTLSSIRGLQGPVQGLWLDCSSSLFPVFAFNDTTGQYVIWPPGSIGWQPFLVKNPVRFTLSSLGSSTIGAAITSSDISTAVFQAGTFRSRSTGVITSVAASVTSVALLAANPQRVGFSIYNEGATTLYLAMTAGPASVTNYSVRLTTETYFVSPFDFAGPVSGIWTTAVGGARITEYS